MDLGHIGFILKKFLQTLASPLTVCLGLSFSGLLILWFARKKKSGVFLASAGFLLLSLLSYTAFSNMLIRPLESRYSPLNQLQNVKGVKWIVVLGAGHNPDPDIPVTSRISPDAMVRLAEGIRIHRQLPDSKLILSGGCPIDGKSMADMYGEVAEALGVDRSRILLKASSMDTEDEARIIQKVVDRDKFILVTTASHMPRSMGLFQKKGMYPIPAPTEYHANKMRLHPGAFFPSSNGLERADLAFHEYLGILWSRIRGQV